MEDIKLLNCKQTAEILGMSPMLFWLKRKKKHIVIPHFKLFKGKAARFKYEDVINLSNSLKNGSNRWDDNSEEKMLDINQAASLLGVSEGTFRSWRWSKKITINSSKINGKIRYKLSDLKCLIEWYNESNVRLKS